MPGPAYDRGTGVHAPTLVGGVDYVKGCAEANPEDSITAVDSAKFVRRASEERTIDR